MDNKYFDANTHTYFYDGDVVPSVTQFLHKNHLAPDLSKIPQWNLYKAAEHGTEVHKQIEEYIKYGTIGFAPEVLGFTQLCNELGLVPVESEKMIITNRLAGTIDVVAKKGNKYVLIDIKTAKKLDYGYCYWQLNLYKWLIEETENIFVDEMYIFHLVGDKAEPIPAKFKRAEVIDQLFLADEEDLYFVEEQTNLPIELVRETEMIESQMQALDNLMKQAKVTRDEVYEKLLKAMQENGIKKYETDSLVISRIDESERVTIDSKKLKEEEPEVYEKYKKTSNVKATVRVKYREEKNE